MTDIIDAAMRHHEDDPRLGQPMCPDCYDYESAVVFNAAVGDLCTRETSLLPTRARTLVS